MRTATNPGRALTRTASRSSAVVEADEAASAGRAAATAANPVGEPETLAAGDVVEAVLEHDRERV